MKNLDGDHLTERQVFQAIVDEADLPGDQQMHLGRCRQCRKDKTRLESDLHKLGQLAKKNAPDPPGRTVLDAPRIPLVRSIPRFWGMSTAAAVSVAFLTVAIWLFTVPHPTEPPDVPASVQAIIADDTQFMSEVGKMVENALPEVYFQILGDSEPFLDDAFMEFMIPSTDNGAITSRPVQKGWIAC